MLARTQSYPLIRVATVGVHTIRGSEAVSVAGIHFSISQLVRIYVKSAKNACTHGVHDLERELEGEMYITRGLVLGGIVPNKITTCTVQYGGYHMFVQYEQVL